MDFAGRMDAIHIVKGTALYTADFTPDTSAPVATTAAKKYTGNHYMESAYKAFKESTHGKSVTEAPSKKETKPKKLTVKQYCEVVISEAKANGIPLEILIEQLSVVAQATKK